MLCKVARGVLERIENEHDKIIKHVERQRSGQRPSLLIHISQNEADQKNISKEKKISVQQGKDEAAHDHCEYLRKRNAQRPVKASPEEKFFKKRSENKKDQDPDQPYAFELHGPFLKLRSEDEYVHLIQSLRKKNHIPHPGN
jgi:hypothetical protein